MKRFNIVILSAIVLFGSGLMSYAQTLPTEGEWGEFAKVVDAEGEIELTGDVDMVGVIRIPLGKTLKITSRKNVTIRNLNIGDITQTSSGRSRMFTVKGEGGELIIEAADGFTITLDGGANYTWDNYSLIPGSGSRTLSEAICNEGTLRLKNVVIRNVNGSDANGGAILVNSNADGPTELTGCTIEKCTSELGSAIMISGTQPVTLTDSKIQYCITGGGTTSNSGGAIRTYGSVAASLYLKKVNFSYNYARRNSNFNNTLKTDGNGGALFWNARGTEDTKCVIDGCRFEYNRSDDNGGAIKSQATLIFNGSPTTITENIAPVGAGLYIEGYTGGSNVDGVRTIDYDLNENLIITDNVSPAYIYDGETFSGKGAGIHYFFGSGMTLEEGSTINVNMNGATIRGNESQGADSQGGGIYFENTSEDGKYTFGIYLNNGTIESNTSEGNGGGIYVYQGDVLSTYTSGKTLTVKGNNASGGAGIYIKEGNLNMANGTITGNNVTTTGNGGGIYIENGDFTINAGEVSSNVLASGQGAGVYIVGSNGKGNFTMNGGEIKGNTTSGNNGGGVYINGGNFTLNQGSINGNESVDGGGVYLNNGNFSLVTGQISDNIVSGNGGGVYLVGENCEYRLKNGSITGNKAMNGGGVFLANGSFILADNMTDIGSISDNTALTTGGGVYIAGNGDFTMNGGVVEKNSTTSGNGGGIFLNGGIFAMNNGNITQNSSASNGGAVYLNGGALKVAKGNIHDNKAQKDGGGLYILNGTVEMGAGELIRNTSNGYGGGVCVHNSSDSKETVSFSGGTLTGNSATYGGGVCVNGLIDLKIGDVEIAENTATNGGGVCLLEGAYMEFGKGQIKNNVARKKKDTTYPTGYGEGNDGVRIDQIEGFGGGIYLDSSTRLAFTYATELGLFGNIADTGGDEIFANGNGTTVDLPDVSQMALEGYPGASNLKWIEDYPTDDPNYDKGTKLQGNAWDDNKTNLRYREAISKNGTIYNLSGETSDDTRYICFALGYEIIYITIIRYGLADGESAIYNLRKNEASDFNIILTGDADGNPITKRVAVTAGEWTVTETTWSWGYQADRTITRAVPDTEPVTNPATGLEEDRPFIFEGTKISALPMNDEDIEINIMGN